MGIKTEILNVENKLIKFGKKEIRGCLSAASLNATFYLFAFVLRISASRKTLYT